MTANGKASVTMALLVSSKIQLPVQPLQRSSADLSALIGAVPLSKQPMVRAANSGQTMLSATETKETWMNVLTQNPKIVHLMSTLMLSANDLLRYIFSNDDEKI